MPGWKRGNQRVARTRKDGKGGQGSLAQGPKNWLLNGFKKEVASDLKIRGFAQVSKQWPWLLQGFKVRASEGGFPGCRLQGVFRLSASSHQTNIDTWGEGNESI